MYCPSRLCTTTTLYCRYHQLAVGGDQLFFNIPGVRGWGRGSCPAAARHHCPSTPLSSLHCLSTPLHSIIAFRGTAHVQVGSKCIGGKLAVTAVTDNSLSNDKITMGRPYEVVLDVVACKAFSGAVGFDLAVGAVSA